MEVSKMKKLIAILLMCLALFPAALAAEKATTEVICINPVDGQGSSNYPRCYPSTPLIDVVFVIDSTGSMQDEIRQVKTHIEKIVREVESGYPRPDIRVGLVTYRDHSPEEYEYLTLNFGFEHDVERALQHLNSIQASGGGDHPEAVADGLNEAINNMDWRDYHILGQSNYPDYNYETQKLIFLIGDASPHGIGSSDNSFEQGCPDGLHYKDLAYQAQERGINIFTVSGSGMDSYGINVWQNIADITGGDYFKLSYQRVDVDQYYKEEGLPEYYAVEAKQDSDYDRSTNTIMVNPFAAFGSAKMMEAAESAGVKYEEPKDDPEEEWTIPITGNVIAPITTPSKFSDFMRSIFSKITFWKD